MDAAVGDEGRINPRPLQKAGPARLVLQAGEAEREARELTASMEGQI
jgi:hypothetical protein